MNDAPKRTVTVAPLGLIEHAFETGAFSEEDRALAWEERHHVEVEVTDDETLSSILKRAGNELGITVPWDPESGAPVPAFFGLRNDGPDVEPRRWGPEIHTTVTTVDEAGRARWMVPYESLTFEELRRSTEAKAISGDPTQLYYCVYPQVGNGVVATWEIIKTAFGIIMTVAGVIATTEDNIGFGQRVLRTVRERMGGGQEAIEAQSKSWRERNGDQYAVRGMLGDRPWHPADLAPLLDCSEAEAEAVLWGLGWAEAESGLWRPGADEAARALAAAIEDIDVTYSLGHDDFADTYERRVRYLLVTGELPPRPGLDEVRHGDEKAIQRLLEASQEELPDADNPYQPEEPEEYEEPDDLPLQYLLLRCACGKPDCHAVAGFGVANGGLKIGFTDPTDHFVIDAAYMERIACQIDAEIEDAKHPDE